ncbi:MAG: ABC transporter permease [Desulfobacter sp.]|nr:ABC transporter permease [Desulfobacter sp.]
MIPALNKAEGVPSPFQVILKDKWLLGFLTWVPLSIGFLIWMIFSQGMVRELSMGIVDLDHSALSQKIARDYDASPDLKVTAYFPSPQEAKAAMVRSRVYAYVVIPKNLEKNINQNLPPKISIFYNTQYILIGKKISSAVLQAQATLNAGISTGKNLAKGNTDISQALGEAVPIRAQITALFNPGTDYAQFLVSGILPALWQICIVVGTILALSAYMRQNTLLILLEKKPIKNIFLALGVLSPFFFVQGLTFLGFFYLYLGWPMHGSWTMLITAQAAMVFSCMTVGALFYFLFMDPIRALSFAGVFTAPSFAFMGVTFPKSDMNFLAMAWRAMLPVSHYMEIQIDQANYGVAPHLSLIKLFPLAGSFIVLILLILLIKGQAKSPQIPPSPTSGQGLEP